MKVILRTNEDDWRELEYKTGGEVVVEHAGAEGKIEILSKVLKP